MEERSAQWVFIREYCFGSMFRFGPNGDFNIPYGGFGYNSKNFTNKIKNNKNYIIELSEKIKTTKLKRYNNPNFNNRQQAEKTCLKRFNSTNIFGSTIGKQHIKNTMLKRYNVEYPMQDPNIIKKAKSKYLYDNQYFDSKYELAFYIWLTSNNIKFTYHPSKFFEYTINNKTHRYFPDFYLHDFNKYIEIKGDHFFKNNKMICPFRHKNETDEQYKLKCIQVEEKYNCMIKNNVLILKQKSDFLQEVVKYIAKQYSPQYLLSFKVCK